MKGIFNLILTIILIGVCIYIDARYIEPKLIWVKEETITTENIVKIVADTFDLKLSVRQYALVHFTIKCFLTTLKNNGVLKIEIIDNILYWKLK